DVGMSAFSSSFARGNENNQHQPDGQYYLGPGKSPGYAVFELEGRYQIHQRLQLFAQVNNLFDRQYYTAAQLGPAGFTENGTFIAGPLPEVGGNSPFPGSSFLSPGAQKRGWVGFLLSF